uniref:Peroxisome assembly protein 12 n=1 Tax=Dermatophagoides pteronyssinus TaxID=6956 RepID=A0A6P6XXN7_DERPT|nr:putative peroxisome assembly protein 12 isoform X1 [Dermatophagoides pteronyssinus]
MSTNRPSIFVVWSEDLLHRSIRRALKFMIKVCFVLFCRFQSSFFKFFSFIQFLSSNNSKFHNLEQNFDEYFLVFDLILQWSHLYRYQTSFTEYYFSLKRSPFYNRSDLFKSLLQLCLVPYAMEKLDNYYEKIHEHYLITNHYLNDDDQNKFIHQYYPFVRKSVQLLRLLIWLSYATGGDHSHCPWFILFWPTNRMTLVNSKFNDDEIPVTNFLSKLSYIMSNIFSITFRSSAFIIQFLDYWNTRTDLRQMFNVQQQQTPPDLLPPISGDNHQNNFKLSSNLCPICGQKRQNETALTSSGYIFCYNCIHSYLMKNHRCPITGFPSDFEQLVRIFS